MPTPPEAITGTPTDPDTAAVQLEVVAVPGAVAVHRGEEDLAGAELAHVFAPRDGVHPGRAPAAVGEDLPPGAAVAVPGVDRHDHALAAELVGQLAARDRGRRARRC